MSQADYLIAMLIFFGAVILVNMFFKKLSSAEEYRAGYKTAEDRINNGGSAQDLFDEAYDTAEWEDSHFKSGFIRACIDKGAKYT
jgi:hypothetical protein